MRVKIERNDHLNRDILVAVQKHAAADTRENAAEFRLTPAQACLVWWGMDCLQRAIRDSARWCDLHGEYADSLRCHADAYEWSQSFRRELMAHAKAHKLEVAPCR